MWEHAKDYRNACRQHISIEEIKWELGEFFADLVLLVGLLKDTRTN
jgi:hypothetical protein